MAREQSSARGKPAADHLTPTQRYYKRHRVRILAKRKQEYAENPALCEARNARERERYRNDPEYRKAKLERDRRRRRRPNRKYSASTKAYEARRAVAHAAARAEAERRGEVRPRWGVPDIPLGSEWTPERGYPPSDRDRAIVKLRLGSGPLTDAELQTVPSRHRRQARIVKRRVLQDIGNMFGLTRERIRQILTLWIKR
jgi:hypothetical protein